MLNKNFQADLVRINGIAGILYHTKSLSDNVVIYGLGAPVVPDNGSLPEARTVMKFNTDLFVPDYIGYARSNGILTPQNCINTFLKIFENFKNGCVAFNYYKNLEIHIKYKRIMFAGRSFGGTYVPLLPRFNSQINELALIFPAVDNKSCGSIKGEEANIDFLRAMEKDGYHYLYRGILSNKWLKHLNNEDGLSPMDNILHLKDANVFIGHGKTDKCINFSKSVIYYDKILECFPERMSQFKIRIYSGGGHDSKTASRAIYDFLNWLKLERR